MSWLSKLVRKQGEMNVNDRPKLGCKAKDTITGFNGVVIAVTEWLNGCVRATIQPQELKDGKPIDAVTFDIEQIEVINPVPIQEVKRSGGPTPEPSRNSL